MQGEPQPHLKRGRFQDYTTSPSTNTPCGDDKGSNSSLVLAAGDTELQSLSFPNSFQDVNLVAYQNGYDFGNVDYTTPYNTQDDPTTGFLYPTPWPFDIPRHVNPLLDAPLWTVDAKRSTMEEISNVHPADFVALALQTTDCKTILSDVVQAKLSIGLRTLEDFLKTAVMALRTAGIAIITYNATRGVIQLRGPAKAAQQARLKLQGILDILLHRAGLQVMKRSSTRWSNAFADEIRSISTKRVHKRLTTGKQLRTFAVRPEDRDLVHAWNDIISPSLPIILGPRIGRSYSVNLVRLGFSELSARPYIRIQSPRLQSPYVKKEIREAISALCDKDGLPRVQLRFSTGSLKLLATILNGLLSRDQKQDEAEVEDIYDASESDDDVQEFPYHKRYWEYPGSGASIGLRCTRNVSATLGGYIAVDEEPYLLAIDHFITKSKENCSSPLADQLVLTSPSLFDVDDMSAQLLQSIQGVRAHISSLCKDLGVHELSRDNLPEPVKELQRTEESLRELRGELEKSDDEFELGKLAHRFRTVSRSATFLNPSLSQPSKRVDHRMDWALFSVNKRQGENRHRYRYENDSMALTSNNPRGDGGRCQATCDPEPNMKVYFVGQRSGRQRGVINTFLTTVCMDDGIVTEEWSIIVQRDRPQEEWQAGDSGAWVYREDNDKLVGQLWGLQEDLLVFTPIHVVFADIKETLEATNVRLHPGFGISEPIPTNIIANTTNTIQICEVKVKTKMPRKLRGYNLGTIPLIKSGRTNPPVRPSISFVMENSTATPQATNERTQYPTPKLTFSPSYPSDHEFGPPTPTSSPGPTSQPKFAPLLTGLEPESDQTPVMIRPEHEDENYGRSFDHLDLLVDPVPPPSKGDLRYHMSQSERMLVGYLRGIGERTTSGGPPWSKARSKPLGMVSKSHTWPVATDRMGLQLLSKVVPLM